MRRSLRTVSLLTVSLCAALVAAACGTKGAADRFGLVDSGAASDVAAPGDATGESIHPDADPTLGAPCNDDGQCARPSIACATFACDLAVHRCRATADDTRCDDGVFCNGAERCDPRVGCVPGAVVDCASGDTCTIDRCVEATHDCVHSPRDADADGDPTAECTSVGGHDCDDHDPTVSSKVAEVCANGKDDNCNGAIDETPCVAPEHSTCDSALVVDADGTYPLSFPGTARSVAASCAGSALYPRQAVIALKVPAGAPSDVDLLAIGTGTRLAIAGGKLCGDATTELGCVAAPVSSLSARLKLRGLVGGTYPVYVFASTEEKAELRVAFLPPTPPATNLSCTTALPLVDGATPTRTLAAELVDVGALPTGCPSAAGPIVYRVDVPAPGPMDLRVRASAGSAGVRTLLGLRDEGCVAGDDELRCGSGYPAELFVRALAAGRHYVTVGATSPTDVTLEATLSAPTTAPLDAACATAPALVDGTTIDVPLAGHEDSIAATCVSVGPAPPIAPDAAYALSLADVSDVLVVAHPSGSDTIGVALAGPACTAADFGCARGYPTRLVRRALAAGDYRVVVESTHGSALSLSTFVRTPAATPGPEGADSCAGTPIVIPPTGGLFVGSTAGKSADFDASCDTGGMPKGGAPDVVYRLDVAKRSRLIVDLAGSAFTTTVSVRGGAACPGVELTDACAAGYVVDNAFLDHAIDAGTYWIIVDGYALASGTYRLDVRVAPPLPTTP